MNDIRGNLERISSLISDINETASDVNRFSRTRKDITDESLSLIGTLLTGNSHLKDEFNRVYKNLDDSLLEIANNSKEFKSTVGYFTEIIGYINRIKQSLNELDFEINRLTKLVDEVATDTDEIFTLALNASIASSKYAHMSGVFDILADKLNEMSIFINQNLQGIVKVVKPITDGIQALIDKNSHVFVKFTDGQESFQEFPGILDKQKDSIDELLLRAYLSGTKIDDQNNMLKDIKVKVEQMDEDARGAIEGSAQVTSTSEELKKSIHGSLQNIDDYHKLDNNLEFIRSNSEMIAETAQNVNEKSKSQLDFSLSCLNFCDSIIAESEELRKTTAVFNEQSTDNNKTASTVSQNLSELTSKLDIIETIISDSNATIDKFNEDYSQIDSIIGFMKNILKSMNVVGMYARVESARDPDEFASFITISDNIRKLQSHIHGNIPSIEDNINKTHDMIFNVNDYFENIASLFRKLVTGSQAIIEKLGDIVRISSESEAISLSILKESENIESILGELREKLMNLTRVVEKPIEGSGKNIERGNAIEGICHSIAQALKNRGSV